MNLSNAEEGMATILGQEFVKMEGETLITSPANEEEVAQVIKKANADGFKVAVVGNEFKGGFQEKPQIVISTARMNKVLELDRDNMLVTVQAGMNLADFQQELLGGGLYFPPDPLNRDRLTIGASVATRAAGPNEANHTGVVDYLLGLTAVLPNGEILKVGGKNYKNVAALDLNRFFGGSYGRLGVITELIFRLLPEPEVKQWAILKFPTFKGAVQAGSILTTKGILPNRLEILNHEFIKLAGEEWPADYRADGVILIEIEGYKESIDYQKEIIKNSLGEKATGLLDLTEAEGKELWQLRVELANKADVLNKEFRFAVDPTKLVDGVEAIQSFNEGRLPFVVQGSLARLLPVFIDVEVAKLAGLKKQIEEKINELGGIALKTAIDYNPETNPDLDLINSLFDVFDPKGIMVP